MSIYRRKTKTELPTPQKEILATTPTRVGASVVRGKPEAVAAAITEPSSGGPQVQAGEFEIQWPIVILYLVIVIVLGSGLIYSLSLGKDYMTFSSSIITAITTIAGFAVGANVAPK